MSNMSYCRFQNTLMDLMDCKEVLNNEGLDGENEYGDKLGRSEFMAAIDLIEMAREIAEQFEDIDLCEMKENYKEQN